MPSDDELFKRTLPAFTKHIQNHSDDRSDEFRKEFFQNIAEQERLSREEFQKSSGQITRVIDRAHIRFGLYKNDAESLGQDFLSAVHSIVMPHCGVLSQPSQMTLFNMLSEQYRRLINREADSLRRIAASMGRGEQAEEMIPTMESTYRSSNTKFQKRLDEQIETHNLVSKSDSSYQQGYSSEKAIKQAIEEQQIYESRLQKQSIEELHNELFKLKDQWSKEMPSASAANPMAFLSHTYQCLHSIRKEIKRRGDASKKQIDETRHMADLTRQANLFAFKQGQPYKKKSQTPPFDTIAETAMKKYFEGVIPRETGKRHRNGQMELTKEWKSKRESIRVTLRKKLKN